MAIIILLKIKAKKKRFIIVWMGGKVERLGVKKKRLFDGCDYNIMCCSIYLVIHNVTSI